MDMVLDSKVLVLNKAYSPISVTTVREAFCKITAEAAEIILVEDGAFYNHDFNSWVEASEFKQMYLDEISADMNDFDWVHTPSLKLIAPRVIRTLTYEKAPAFNLRLTRKNIYDRDNHRCQYCGKKFDTEDLNLDHVIPKAKGGKNTWDNLVCSCIKCNRRKKDDTLKESGFKLLRKPVKPKPSFKIRVGAGKQRYSEWDSFISAQYWETPLLDK